jgi:hypothetical protein
LKATNNHQTSLYAGFSPSARKQFDFDAVLDVESTQQQTYEAAVGDKALHQIFKGVNFTIMAYGQVRTKLIHHCRSLVAVATATAVAVET